MKLKRNSQYFYLGVTLLSVIFFSIVLWTIFNNLTGFFGICKTILHVASPVLYGFVFAYILNPVMIFSEKYIQRFLRHIQCKERTVRSAGRAISVTIALVVGLMVVYGFFALLLPSLVESITTIFTNMPGYYKTMRIWIQDLTERYPQHADTINNVYDQIYNSVRNWLENTIIANVDLLVVTVTTQIYGVVKTLLNLLVGIVAAIYLLVSKEKFIAQSKKMLISLTKRSYADRILKACSRTNQMFSSFISGKILDSLIIGFLCYIGMRLFGLPYPELVSTIVGVTNVIPFFGPFIGAVPSILLILLVDPMQALYFAIFVLVLQQLDGNLIGPYILGDAVGLPSFWILVSITVAGGLFGFVGMLLGVPVFAVVYMFVREAIERRLAAKGVPISTSYYYHVSTTDDLEQVSEASEEKTQEVGQEF